MDLLVGQGVCSVTDFSNSPHGGEGGRDNLGGPVAVHGIGSLGFLGVQGLDVSPGGGLFAWDVQDGLLTVNSVTGLATDVNASIGGTAQIQSIVFAPDGRLFGAGATLYSINPRTGAFSQIGAGGGPDIRGIEWIAPEPSAAMLIAMAGIGLLRRRTRGRSA